VADAVIETLLAVGIRRRPRRRPGSSTLGVRCARSSCMEPPVPYSSRRGCPSAGPALDKLSQGRCVAGRADCGDV